MTKLCFSPSTDSIFSTFNVKSGRHVRCLLLLTHLLIRVLTVTYSNTSVSVSAVISIIPAASRETLPQSETSFVSGAMRGSKDVCSLYGTPLGCY